MIKLASRLSKVRVSPTVDISNRARALRAEGHDVISLAAGEPNFDTPNNIQAAANEAMQRGETHYTMVEGVLPLREAICNKLKTDNQLDYEPAEIITGAGGKQIIYNAMMATLEPGDEVIIPAPYWVSYPDIALLFGGEPVIVKTTQQASFKISADQLQRAITAKTRWLFLNSPSNPTGAVYTEAEFKALGEVLEGHPNVLVMTDDIYEKVVYPPARFINFVQANLAMKSRTLIVNGLSKSHAMTGWRLGYGAAPKELIAGMKKLQGQSSLAPSSISQWAGVEALAGTQAPVEHMAAEFTKRKDKVFAAINAVEGLDCFDPAGAFYLFVSIKRHLGKKTAAGKAIKADTDWVLGLMEEEGVSVVPGSAFGSDGYFRLSFAASEEDLNMACERIARYCDGIH